jgi:hypothetical protein
MELRQAEKSMDKRVSKRTSHGPTVAYERDPKAAEEGAFEENPYLERIQKCFDLLGSIEMKDP